MEKTFVASLPLGLAAAVAAALLGAGSHVAIRLGVTSDLRPLDLALLRFCVPALLLAPLLVKRGLWPSAAPCWLAAPMFLGGGLPFGLVSMSGALYAPVAHMGALMPGTMPVFAALLAALLLGDRPRLRAIAGFAAIAVGIAAIAGPSLAAPGEGSWRGDILFLCAAFMWAVFTVAFRRSGLDPWHATALVAAISAFAVVPLWLIFADDALARTPVREVAFQALWHGVLAGLGGMWTYALAIRHLGAARAALSGAPVPALSAIGGALVLGEFPAAIAVAGIALTVAGTLVAGWPRKA